MKMTVEAKLMDTYTDGVKIGVRIDHINACENLIPEFYRAMITAMRDAHEHEFHMAMIDFIGEELRNDKSTD